MSIISTQAVVLRYADYKEADRILTLFSPVMGKITVSARGCRKSKSRLLAGAQLFCYGDYLLFKMGNSCTMSQVEVRDSFFNVRNDLRKLAYATYVLNLTEESVAVDERNSRLFHLLLSTLAYLSYDDADAQDVVHVFESKLIDILGYRPRLDECVICNAKYDSEVVRFSALRGGVVCPDCSPAEQEGYLIHMSTVQTIKHMLQMDMRKLKVLKVSAQVRDELEQVLPCYLGQILEKQMKSRKVIKKIEQHN